MKRKLIKFLALGLVLASLTGCGQNTEKYSINKRILTISEFTEGMEEINIDYSKYTKTPEFYDLNNKYKGFDLSSLLLTEYYGNTTKTLAEWNKESTKPVILLFLQPYCSSCNGVDFEEFMNSTEYDVWFLIQNSEIKDEKYEEKGITSRILTFSYDKLIENEEVDERGTYKTYLKDILTSVGTPGQLVLNKDLRLILVSNGDKDTERAKQVYQYAK